MTKGVACRGEEDGGLGVDGDVLQRRHVEAAAAHSGELRGTVVWLC